MGYDLLLMAEIPNNHLGCKNPTNDGRSYQPQLVQDFSHQQYHLLKTLGVTVTKIQIFKTRCWKVKPSGSQLDTFRTSFLRKDVKHVPTGNSAGCGTATMDIVKSADVCGIVPKCDSKKLFCLNEKQIQQYLSKQL